MAGAAADSTALDRDAVARTETLAGPVDLAGFRAAARRLFAEGVAPSRVRWRVAQQAPDDLFGEATQPAVAEAAPACSPTLRVPPAFLETSAAVVMHCDPDRFTLLYRLLWRLQHEPGLRSDPLDPDWIAAERMARSVHRDLHKMKAFVRFRPLERDGAPPLHVAWFEPEHHVVEAAAPFFRDRFANLHWSILTPRRSVAWDGHELVFGAGARAEAAPPADAGEALWLTYYAHVFNPARLKLATMRREMPRRYWPLLPEATLIAPLTEQAQAREAQMIGRPATEPPRYAQAARASCATSRADNTPPAIGIDPGGSATARSAAWRALGSAAADCRRCALHAAATRTVFGEGPLDAALMFVGEQPGDEEDLRGRPFVGPSGALFERALRQAGIARDTVYVTNAVKHFKFELRGKRRMHKTPAQQEAAACLDWLEREIALVEPGAVIALGATAARAVLGRPVAVLKERGRWFERADGVPVFVTLHPAALLRTPEEERDTAVERWFEDFRNAAQPRRRTR